MGPRTSDQKTKLLKLRGTGRREEGIGRRREGGREGGREAEQEEKRRRTGEDWENKGQTRGEQDLGSKPELQKLIF